MRSTLYNEILARPALASALRTNGTVNGSAADKADPSGGYDGFTTALLVVQAATITDGTHTVTIQDSDDGSTWAAADPATVQGAPVALTSAQSNTVAELGYTGPKRYVRASVTTSGATTGGTLGAVVILGGQTALPVKR